MLAFSLPEALTMIMEGQGLSQTELARHLGRSQTWVSKVKGGKVDPPFGQVSAMLRAVGLEVCITPIGEVSDLMKRRNFIAGVASVAFVPSPKTGPYEDPAYVRELTRRLAYGRYEQGGATVVSSAMRHLGALRKVGNGRDRALQSAVSDFACETVWTLNDMSELNVGEDVGRLALDLARRAGDTEGQSRALSVLSAINVSRRDADHAVMYAREGLKVHEVSDVQRLWMNLRLGWSLAMVNGQQHTARDIVEYVSGTLQDDRNGRMQSAFDAADMRGTVGLAFNDLGLHQQAHTTLGECAELMQTWSPVLEGVHLSRQVVASLHTSQPQRAAEEIMRLARIAPIVNSARLDGLLREVLFQSAGWTKVPEIRTARAQLRSVLPPGKRSVHPAHA